MRGTPSAQGAVIYPAWSPDGQTIAAIGFEPVNGVHTRQAVFVNVADGSQRSIPLHDAGSADGIDWLDARQLIVTQKGLRDLVSQMWVLAYPEGTWSRVTNDLSNYGSFSVSSPSAIQWSPDGRAYSAGSNVWVQPLDVSAASQLTRFPEDERRIEDFEWSPDGKRLAFSRSRTTWDIVLFRGLKTD